MGNLEKYGNIKTSIQAKGRRFYAGYFGGVHIHRNFVKTSSNLY